MEDQLFLLDTEDGESIALWKSEPEEPSGRHIFLTHGTFSSRKVCGGIIAYLTNRGFTCWMMEWRNHGDSPKANKDFNIESIGLYDIKASFEFLFNAQGVERLDCITHSGGGIALTLLLIKEPHYRTRINTIVLFGVQAFGAATDFSSRLKVRAGKYMAALLGRVPAKIAGSSERDESYYTMKQWFNWNLRQNLNGDDGFDYLSKMPEIRVPILSICAKGDTLIAPKVGCQQFLDAFQNDANKLIYLSLENGNLENYDHSRIIKSRNSEKEVFPQVEEWIRRGGVG